MIKILFYSLVFFAIEAALLLGGQNIVFKQYALNAPVFYNCQNRAQQLTTDAVVSAHMINASENGGRVILGGSSSQVFVSVINFLEDPALREMIHRGDTGSQKFWDALRIIDNPDHPDASVLLVLHPRKFLNSDSRNAITRSKYSYGLSGSFPINSQAFERVAVELESENGIDSEKSLGGGVGAFKKHLFFPLNFFAQAARECVEETVDDRLIKPLENWQAASKRPSSDISRAIIGAAIAATDEEIVKTQDQPKIEELPWKEQAAPFRKWLETASKPENVSFRYAESLALLEEILETAERRGVKLIIVDAPLSEVHKEELMPFIPDFYEDVAALVEKFATAHYIRFDQSTVPGNMDYFLDAIHLTPDGWQDYYFDYLIDAITFDLTPVDGDNPS
ncbi:MAG: hypothetical protein ACR2QF_15725 [Geminicoccaceae bacterium]